MAKTEKVPVLISVDQEHLPRMKQIVERCRAAGLDVDQALDQIGAITGSIDPGKIDHLSKVAGVASVERSGEYDIGPPDSELQ
jgi:methylmalonyl-CoA mutase cobalamin-binding subunit